MFRELDNQRQQLCEHLALGGTINNESADATLANTCLVVGEIRGIDRLKNIDWEDEET